MDRKENLITYKQLVYVLVAFSIIIVSCFYFYLSSQNEIIGMIADDAIYMLMADYFSPYNSSLRESAAFVMQTSQFPPLYPFLLSIVGANSGNIFWAHVITTFFLILGIYFYYVWLQTEKVNKQIALCIVLLVMTSPATFLMNIDLWSEHLYLLLTFSIFFFLNKAEKNQKFLIITILLISLLPLVRTIGIAFVAAYMLFLIVNKMTDKYKYLLLSIFPFFLWKLISYNYFQSDIYQSTLSDFYRHDIWLHIQHIYSSQLLDLWQGWHECFDIRRNDFSGIVCSIVLLFSFIGLTLRIIDKKLDSFYVVFYLLIILVWPDNNHNMRFIFPVFPILLFYACLSLQLCMKIISALQIKKIINSTSLFVILMTYLPTNLYALNRLSIDPELGLEKFKTTRYWLTVEKRTEAEHSIPIMERMRRSYIKSSTYIPEDACVYTAHQEQFMFYARKLAYPLPLPNELNNKDIFSKCDFIHVLHTTSHPEYPGGYPTKSLKHNFVYIMSYNMNEGTNSPVVAQLIKLEKNNL